jgi:murein DD-endopeptidase MepM/ murein hydrolase activator NlpD
MFHAQYVVGERAIANNVLAAKTILNGSTQMPHRQHTIILVPHAKAKLLKWRVTNLQLGVAGCTLLALTAVALGLLWSYFHDSSSPAELARLRQENQKLRHVNSSFEKSLKNLGERLSASEDRTRQLAIMAGVESLGTNGEAGVGGPMPAEDAGADLSSLENRTGQLAGTLDAVQAKLQDRLLWISSTPAIAPVKGILTSGFGYRSDPMTHGRGSHEGIDIAAPPGRPVQATADGVVLSAAEENGYGKAVLLSHGFGLATRYAHLSQLDVKPGQRIHRGDIVGRVGSTGRSTGYHLHYEVRIDGEPVNPLAYFLDGAGQEP